MITLMCNNQPYVTVHNNGFKMFCATVVREYRRYKQDYKRNNNPTEEPFAILTRREEKRKKKKVQLNSLFFSIFSIFF